MYQLLPINRKEGAKMAVFVDKVSPNRGALVLTDREETTGPFVVCDDQPGKKFPIISLRRPPELCGVEEPVFEDPLQFEKWRRPYVESFIDALQQVCDENKITELGIVASNSWNESPYSSLFDVKIFDVTGDIYLSK